jgi:hypothetical protein
MFAGVPYGLAVFLQVPATKLAVEMAYGGLAMVATLGELPGYLSVPLA